MADGNVGNAGDEAASNTTTNSRSYQRLKNRQDGVLAAIAGMRKEFELNMPSTRSNGQAQPTLAFPRRKSCRVSSHGKTPQREESPAASPSKPETQNLNLGRIGPMSPRRPAVARTSAVSSPLSLRAPPSSPRLQTRLPLSPRKRTESSASTRTLRSPFAAGWSRRCRHGNQSPNTGSSPRRQDTPAGTPGGKTRGLSALRRKVEVPEREAGFAHGPPGASSVPRGGARRHPVLPERQSPAESPRQPLHLRSARHREDRLLPAGDGALPLACLPSQPVQAVEGGSAPLQCRLDPPIDLSSTTVEWNRGHTRYVHVYRSRRDDPDSQMLQYRDRTALNHGDLTRGVLTLTISNVSLSNNGSYEVYLPKLGVRCSTHLTVVTKEQENQTKRNDSSTTSPPAGERNDASNREAGRAAIILTVLLILCVLVVLLVLKRGKTMIGLSCSEEGRTEKQRLNEYENKDLNTEAETEDLQRDESETSVSS
ncbi:uncharacterized protein LOC117481983 [Trematomus bernacchii]|uniref:uncharacterized protein LOC117481983 n=1 Tax=Trematomus bernacchii TaxID=40690 RepID=UPI00146C07EA|nr:uncharacterized protein LOC117481983 [Trematomus bernacchii]